MWVCAIVLIQSMLVLQWAGTHLDARRTYRCCRRTDGSRNGGSRVGLGWVVPLRSTLGSVLRQTSFQLLWSLDLGFLRLGLASDSARRRVAGSGAAFSLHLEILVQNTLLVRVNKVLRNAAHAEDLGVDTLAALNRIFDASQGLLMNLLQVHRQAASSVETTVAVVATEVLCFLVREEDSGVVEVALAVVTPRALDEFLNLGVVALLDHDCSGRGDLM